MQKFYLKIKDKWWWVIVISVFIGWVITKILDHFLTVLSGKTEFFSIKIFSFLSYKVPLYVLLSYFLALVIGIGLYKLVQIYRVSLRDFKILKATYGKNEFSLDITEELNAAVSNNSLNIVLSNNIAGDPCYGVRKIGRVKYQYRGEVLERDYLEGELIILPRSSLNEAQVQSIVALLASFGAEPDVIRGAEKALRERD